MKFLRAQSALETLIKEMDAEIKALTEEKAATVRALENIKRTKSKNGKLIVDIEGLGLIDAAKVILLNSGNIFMSTEEIAEALKSSGYETASNDFKSVVSTMLNKYKGDTDGIKSIGRGQWALAD